MKCCNIKVTRSTKGFGHLVERYECAKCGGMWSPFFLTLSAEGISKYNDVKVADYLESQITWLKEQADA